MAHTFISLGCNCRPTFHLRRRGDHHVFPLDWLYSPDLAAVVRLLLADWEGFLDPQFFIPQVKPNALCGKDFWVNTKYGIKFKHDDLDWDIWKDLAGWLAKLEKRIVTFRYVTAAGPVTFIREGGTAVQLQPLYGHFPNAKFLLINDGPLQLVQRTDRLEEWTFPPDSPDYGPSSWIHTASRWDQVLNALV